MVFPCDCFRCVHGFLHKTIAKTRAAEAAEAANSWTGASCIDVDAVAALPPTARCNTSVLQGPFQRVSYVLLLSSRAAVFGPANPHHCTAQALKANCRYGC